MQTISITLALSVSLIACSETRNTIEIKTTYTTHSRLLSSNKFDLVEQYVLSRYPSYWEQTRQLKRSENSFIVNNLFVENSKNDLFLGDTYLLVDRQYLERADQIEIAGDIVKELMKNRRTGAQ